VKLFDQALSVPTEEVQILLHGHVPLLWSGFWLNPRRLRGSDFLMRWSQGAWSEERLIRALEETDAYFALPYGPSSVAPDGDVQEFELYFEELEKAGFADEKRPDLLVYSERVREQINEAVDRIGGNDRLPFTPEKHTDMGLLLSRAILAVECENSLWVTKNMPDYGAKLQPMKRLGGRLGLRKNAVLPTVILKEEDRSRLWQWQKRYHIPIHIWHVFFDAAFGLSLAKAQKLIESKSIEPTVQIFQAPSGATTKKTIYKIFYQHAYPLARSMKVPELRADFIEDKNGHILPYVKFTGGSLSLAPEALAILSEAARAKTLRK
jgi:hypothetical protein